VLATSSSGFVTLPYRVQSFPIVIKRISFLQLMSSMIIYDGASAIHESLPGGAQLRSLTFARPLVASCAFSSVTALLGNAGQTARPHTGFLTSVLLIDCFFAVYRRVYDRPLYGFT
jgi:hypothetical protein